MNVAAVLASGTGSRMKSDIPKQFLPLNGIPVIIYSSRAFLSNENVDALIICVSPQMEKYTNELINTYLVSDKPIHVVYGGKTRGESLLNVLEFTVKNKMDNGIILTHDSVRPFIDDHVINDSIKKCKEHGAAIACKPATDTMFITDENGVFINSVPDRACVYHAQTPQTFYTKELYDAITSLPYDVFEKMTDAGSVYSYIGKPVAVSQGTEENIKITFPGDIERAEKIAERLKICQH